MRRRLSSSSGVGSAGDSPNRRIDAMSSIASAVALFTAVPAEWEGWRRGGVKGGWEGRRGG